MQEQFEAHPVGRIVISVFVVFTVAAILVSNLPSSRLKRLVAPVFRPYLNSSGLNQAWDAFAPNPRSTSYNLEGRILFRDGTRATWRPPRSDVVRHAYTTARWRRWANNVLDFKSLHGPTAAWLARTHARPGKEPQIIQLVKLSHPAHEPGSGRRGRPPWREEVIYTTFVPRGTRL
jgi:hypothetical protein